MSNGPSPEDLVGSVLSDTYRVERMLGRGGMGAVFAARHLRLDQPVAVKLLYGAAGVEPGAFERFEREARICSSLGSKYIVRVSDFDRTPDGAPFMVMELLEGQDLARAIATSGPLETVRAVAITRHVASALAAAHGAQIVHRDIKPGNIFLCTGAGAGGALVELGRDFGAGETARVLDFGIAKLLGRQGLYRTAPGGLVGSPWYMAPEQAEGEAEAIDGRADLFALGAVLYHMLGGKPPFAAESLPALLYQIVHKEPQHRLHELNDAVPPGVERAVERAMSKRPEERPQSAAELVDELHAALADRWQVVVDWDLPAAAPVAARPHEERTPSTPDTSPLRVETAELSMETLDLPTAASDVERAEDLTPSPPASAPAPAAPAPAPRFRASAPGPAPASGGGSSRWLLWVGAAVAALAALAWWLSS